MVNHQIVFNEIVKDFININLFILQLEFVKLIKKNC